jgi:hypothetical protein
VLGGFSNKAVSGRRLLFLPDEESLMRKILAITLLVLLAGTTASAVPQTERFLANAMALGGVSGTARIEFTIESWSTPEERAHLLTVLAEQGQEALMDALRKAGEDRVIGRVRVNTRLSYPISYAFAIPLDGGGRRIVIATDRPIGALEAIAGSRTLDYAVSIAELKLDADNKGEGALMVAASVVADMENHTISLENYGQAPVQLRNVRAE